MSQPQPPNTDSESSTPLLETQGPMGSWQDASAIQILGATAEDFLQGYLTSNTQRLESNAVIPMALCTIKGRTLASGWAIRHSAGVDLVVHASLANKVMTFLKPYVTFSKCEMAANAQPVLLKQTNEHVIPHIPGFTIELGEVPAQTPDWSEQINNLLVANGFVFVCEATSESFLPQMLNLDDSGAIDFDKGCYLGQEIVARAQFRGAVKRTTAPFTWEGKAPEIGSDWENGTVVSVAKNHSGLYCRKVAN